MVFGISVVFQCLVIIVFSLSLFDNGRRHPVNLDVQFYCWCQYSMYCQLLSWYYLTRIPSLSSMSTFSYSAALSTILAPHHAHFFNRGTKRRSRKKKSFVVANKMSYYIFFATTKTETTVKRKCLPDRKPVKRWNSPKVCNLLPSIPLNILLQ